MPGLDPILVMSIVVGAMILFVTGRVRVDVTALLVLLALLAFRLITPNQALYGFANPATATVAAMFVLSAGLVRTGLVQWLARQIDRLAGTTEAQLVLVLCVAIAALSAFIVNTATVAIFIPVAIVLAKARDVSPSRVLMPLSFASQFGGVCTLIGTSTNILVNSIAITAGMRAFGLFEFAPLGLIMSIAGIAYLLVVTRWLLPKREGEVQQVDKYRLSDYLSELRVTKDSPLIGQTWAKSKARSDGVASLVRLIREGEPTWRSPRTEIREGDVLMLRGDADKLLAMRDKYGLELAADVPVDDQKLSSDKVKLFEALVPPQSRLVGRTLRGTDFSRRYGSAVLALQRRGRSLRERIADVRLEGGDALLLQGDTEGVARLMRSSDLVVTTEMTELYLRKDRAVTALVLLVAVVALAALNIVPILIAAMVGAVGMVVFRCISIEEAYRAIDWRVIFLLGGILPLGLALQQSGAARLIADNALGPIAEFGPLAVLAGLYIVTAILTETMSNNAAAVLLAPIALSLASSLGVDPRPFLVAITFAASTSFATPVGYQTNTMIFAPGGYRFADFLRVGGPLNLLFWVLAVVFIPRLWPF